MRRLHQLRSPVTVSRVAREAGVSAATVSLVLNQRGNDLRIGVETQQRVLDAARRLDYVPNYLARGLSGKPTRTIGLIWPLGGAASNAAIAYRLIQRLASRGYLALMTDHLRDPALTRRWLTDLAQRSVDGVILHGGGDIQDDQGVRSILTRFRATVVISPRPLQLQADVIYHTRQPAMRQIVDHLADSGRRRIGLLTVGRANETKFAAFRQRLRERGLKITHDDVLQQFSASDDASYPREVGPRLDALYPARFPYDAVACTNDELAVATLKWLRGRDFAVPGDVALTGFDDTPSAAVLTPALASVARRDTEVADCAERMLFERMDQPTLPSRNVEIAMQFVWRASAGGKPAQDPRMSPGEPS